MELISLLMKGLEQGKIEVKLALLFILGLIISTGSENILMILLEFQKNEIFGFLFIRQLWIVYSLFFIGLTAYMFGCINLKIDEIKKLIVEKEGSDEVVKARSLFVAGSGIQGVLKDILKALAYSFCSMVFILPLILVELNIRINSTGSIIAICSMSLILTKKLRRALEVVSNINEGVI